MDGYKEKYEVECTAALHHNKSMTNFHIHMIYSERRELQEPIVKIATRDRYYDPDGKHVRTKKEATDEKGNLLPGYSKIARGEVYESHRFESKDKRFKKKDFLQEAKGFFTELMNPMLSEKSQMHVFPKDSPYLATKKIGKNNPRAEQIKEDNRIRDDWNKQVDIARANRVPYESMQYAKRRLITDQIHKSHKVDGGRYNTKIFRAIVRSATHVLGIMISQSSRMSKEEWYKAWVELLDNFIEFCFEVAFGVRLSEMKFKSQTPPPRVRKRDDWER